MPNTSAEIELEFGDGPHLFKLGLKQIEHLQKICDAPIGTIAARLFAGVPFHGGEGVDYRDIYHTIHQGLIGGGMPPVEATALVRAYVDGQPIDRANDKGSPLKTAKAIIGAVFFGFDDLDTGDPPGEAPAGQSTGESTPRPSEQSSPISE